jgi:hypothetical protein
MNRIGITLVGLLLTTAVGFGQASGSAAAQSAPAAIGHGSFPVKVVKTLDSAKLKEGDPVELETSGAFKLADGTMVPKGSKLAGHVTSSKARSKGDTDSELTVAFDRLNVANGKQLSVKGVVQAVFPPADEVDPGVAGASSAQGGRGGGATPTAPPPPDYRPMNDIKNGSNSSGGRVEPSADPKSVGVQGIDNLNLENGVLTSKGKQVKLGGGVRMIVRVEIFG